MCPQVRLRLNQFWDCFPAFLLHVKNVNYLEQSCPLHPGLQWHLFGLMHRPPLRQGEEHMAVGNTKTVLMVVLVCVYVSVTG